MGRGDKKTKRGKIFMGSFGKLRPSKKLNAVKPTATTPKTVAVQEPVAEPAPKKKAVARKSKSVGD